MGCVFIFEVALTISPAQAADAPAPQIPAAAHDQVIARVNGDPITLDRLMAPLIEGYGLNILLNLAQLEATRQAAEKARVTCTSQDFAAEREQTIEKMFIDSNAKLQDQLDKAVAEHRDADAQRIRTEMKQDNERAFKQFLDQRHSSEAEFDIVIQANAYLRKMAEPLLANKITDQNLQDAFAALYGETVECRHIQCATLQDITEAKRRLNAGEPFEKVASELSQNQTTKSAGGKMPPFSRATQGLPEVFKQAAFALKPGEISDIVQAEGAFHLIQLEKRNPPRAVKFEDVKESIRRDLHDRAVQVTMKQLRAQIAEETRNGLVIQDPLLNQQYQDKLTQRNNEIKEQEQIREQMLREHLKDQPPATTAPRR
jgi:parvulin-like peptidyl-prolyl isomerase